MGSNDMAVLQGGFAPVQREITVDLTDIEGEIPRDLHGMHVRNGPNRQFAAPGRYHWFDGDGMLHALRFEGGRVQYQNRWKDIKEEIGNNTLPMFNTLYGVMLKIAGAADPAAKRK